MTEGVDFSYANISGAALAAAGKVFAMRYLTGAGKALTEPEIADLRGAGIDIGLIFESSANRALDGKQAGIEDARTASLAAAHLGAPLDTAIYFAVDFNAQVSDQPLIDAYLKGAQSIIGERVGVYGGYGLVKRCAASKTAAWFWQTYAWSAGNVFAGAHVLQYNNGEKINTEWVDLCRAFRPFGQWAANPQSGPIGGDVLKISDTIARTFDIGVGVDVLDPSGAKIGTTTQASTGLASPFVAVIGPTHYLAFPTTSGGVQQLGLVHLTDAKNVKAVVPPPVDTTPFSQGDIDAARAAGYESARSKAIAAVEAL